MNRTIIHLIGMLAMLVTSAFVSTAMGIDQVARPNIVIFLADDLGYADMSCRGSDIATPHIDSLERNGVSCTQAYATAPVCAPSRVALLTGRYQHRFGFEDNPGPFRRSPDIEVGLDLNERTIADRLKRLGYTTGMIGKLHDGKDPRFQPPARGFDEFYGFNNGAQRYINVDSSETPMMRGTKPEKHGEGYLTDTFGREAAAFVERNRDKPFFLYVSFNAPHGPLTASETYLKKYASIKDIKRRTYAAMVDAMDVAVGRVLAKLRQHKLEDNTLIMFLSDHGGVSGKKGHWASNGSLRAGKGTMFEGGLRTPLFIQWKSKLPAGGVVEHPVTTMDLLPTAVAAAGENVDPQWKLDGVNLLPHLRGKNKARPHQTIYWRMNEMWAIRDGDWKVFKDRGTVPPQLFNLAKDPGEKQNVAGQNADKLKQLKSKYDAWSNSVERPRFGWWQGIGPRLGDAPPVKPSNTPKHLFILSGQSNMQGLRPEESFTPTVGKEFGKDNVIVVIDALGGQPIRRWYKNWKPAEGDEPKATGDLYDRLMAKVDAATKGKKIQTVSFIWMQGERDAKEQFGEVYSASLNGLYDQLREDLNRKDINFVIGRLSDFDMKNEKYPHWTMVREAQVQVACNHPRGAWVDTDNLNDGVNRQGKQITDDLHYSARGYVLLGRRFALSSIRLIKKNAAPIKPQKKSEKPTAKPAVANKTASGFRMHRIFSDNMILQQHTSNAIWGWAKPGDAVTVKASWDAQATAKANKDGKWTAFLKTPGHGTGHTLTVNNKTIKNVAIGEVWLCAGQSNMGWSMGNSFGAEEEAKNANAPDLRIFKSQREHWHEPLDISRDLLAKWKPCTPESAAETSAVSYYFGKTIQAELGIPVGIIVQAYAGTPIEGWMPKEIQTDDSRLKAGMATMDQLSRRHSKEDALKKFETELVEYKKKIAAGETMKNRIRPLAPPFITQPANLGHQYPSHIFNAMIHPIRPYGIRGVIWYQGERNSKNPAQAANYRRQLARLIDNYRSSWHELSGGNVADDFPFFFTQLPSWTPHQTKPVEGPEAPWAISREMMRLVTEDVPNTAMAVSIDTGDTVELHPKNKQPIGLRHAYLALVKVYGKDITGSGPAYVNSRIDGSKIIVSFDSTGSGLTTGRPGKLDAFAIAGKDKQWHWANATIEGNTVTVSSPQVPQPLAVRYAWAMNPSKRNLIYNKEGFPASPFRTDDWSLVDREYPARETSYEKPAKSDGYVAKDWARPVMNVAASPQTSKANTKPNILFIFSDDHALRTIGAYGSRFNKTPNLDRIANEGAIFTRSYNTNSICCPSRASILTGKHSHKNGVTGNGSKWNSNQFVFTRDLSHTGYSTALIGKWHIKGLPAAGEFDHFQILSGAGGQGHYYNPEFVNMDGSTEHATGYSTDIITNKSINWMTKQRAAGKPFMLMCNFKAPHIHRIPPPRHMNSYDDVTLPIPSTFFDDFKNRSPYAGKCWMKLAGMQEPILNITPRAGQYDINERKFEFLKRMTPAQRDAFHKSYDPDNDAYRRDLATGKLNGDDLSRYKYQRFIKDYVRCVDAIDDNVGRLLRCLEDNKLADNTVVVYSSDQGFFTGEHGWNDKRWMYEETVSMPLMMRWPGHIKPGTRVNAMVQNIDYAPTFLEIAGAKMPVEVQGRSLLPLFSGSTPSDWRKAIYYHYYDDGSYNLPRFEGVRDARYKLVNYYFPKQEWELFDLDKDPNEIRSVYGDPAYTEVQKKLNQDLQRLRKQYDLPPLNLKPR